MTDEIRTTIQNARTAEDLESYTRDFNAAYMQGIQGQKLNTARFTITDEQARAAYAAGRGDADSVSRLDSNTADMTFDERKKESVETSINDENAFTDGKNDGIITSKHSQNQRFCVFARTLNHK